MRKLILTGLLIGLVYASCETTSKEETTAKEHDAVLTETPANVAVTNEILVYSCSMHPAVSGNKGDKCPDCGMELTEKVISEDGTSNATGEVFACPMHPEVTGAKNAKCSVCGMGLTEVVKK